MAKKRISIDDLDGKSMAEMTEDELNKVTGGALSTYSAGDLSLREAIDLANTSNSTGDRLSNVVFKI